MIHLAHAQLPGDIDGDDPTGAAEGEQGEVLGVAAQLDRDRAHRPGGSRPAEGDDVQGRR